MLTRKESCKRYRLKNKEKIKEYKKLYNKSYKKTEKGKFFKRKERYKLKISFLEYKELVRVQKNLCGICGKQELKKSLAIDHNHTTGKIRGLLCQKCNRGIGLFNDSPELVARALRYLK